ncbi:hypothetical protein PO613_35835, partial [Streptomyces heilongjiangensis]|nr:hypothetical protein [Streptomyces heilongjiangensis]
TLPPPTPSFPTPPLSQSAPRRAHRREELLLTPGELTAVRGLRRALRPREGQAALDTLLERLRATPDNAAFLRQVQPTLPAV